MSTDEVHQADIEPAALPTCCRNVETPPTFNLNILHPATHGLLVSSRPMCAHIVLVSSVG